MDFILRTALSDWIVALNLYTVFTTDSVYEWSNNQLFPTIHEWGIQIRIFLFWEKILPVKPDIFLSKLKWRKLLNVFVSSNCCIYICTARRCIHCGVDILYRLWNLSVKYTYTTDGCQLQTQSVLLMVRANCMRRLLILRSSFNHTARDRTAWSGM